MAALSVLKGFTPFQGIINLSAQGPQLVKELELKHSPS